MAAGFYMKLQTFAPRPLARFVLKTTKDVCLVFHAHSNALIVHQSEYILELTVRIIVQYVKAATREKNALKSKCAKPARRMSQIVFAPAFVAVKQSLAHFVAPNVLNWSKIAPVTR